MSVCDCKSGFKNTGFSCTSIAGIAIGEFKFNRFKENGDVNQIDFNTEAVNGKLPIQAILDRVNDPNPFDRWYPIGLYENVEDTRAEILSQTFNSGNVAKIRDGIRSASHLLINKAPKFTSVLEAFGCGDSASIIFDTSGNLIGESVEEGKLRGLANDGNSVSAIFGKTTDSEVSAIAYSYNFAQSVSDANLSMIGSGSIEGDVTILKGLLDTTISANGATIATAAPVSVIIDYGMDITDKIPLKSLVLADFAIQNVTQSAAVTIDSVDSSLASEGKYTLNYSAGVTVADVLLISATKQGYEISNLSQTVV